MKTAGMQRTDHEILQAVRDELDWTPDVDAARIGVAVDHGGVTLTGEVPSYTERVAATRAALRVHGVLALADELIVNPPAAGILTDSTIAQAIEHAFEYAGTLPSTVKATVSHGRVTLTGTADWNYERAQARRLVRGIKGARDVLDLIELTPRASADATSKRIHAALLRNAALDAQSIHVTAEGTRVKLTGTVRSIAERRQAELAAWADPNVTAVDNQLLVAP
ncbi:BON domain-containing protein [Pseudolysinimonas kribbensis]|uniref:Ornithine aminotransferase n=1 Tax=Pseudolysinimonas kribbensis TaxID=433641 RepID=A0ABQ6KFJ4_9MICO|nr:BON domain-containing protein [Pseudolysinimonas kribbensis]GMA96951.1 ornithine aminotransferase [Pseudolysinimonas kribbensis]